MLIVVARDKECNDPSKDKCWKLFWATLTFFLLICFSFCFGSVVFKCRWKFSLVCCPFYLISKDWNFRTIVCLPIERDDYFLTHRFRRSSSFFTKNFTAVHERLLRAPWLLFMQSSHGPFPGTTPVDMKRPRWSRTALFSSFVHGCFTTVCPKNGST